MIRSQWPLSITIYRIWTSQTKMGAVIDFCYNFIFSRIYITHLILWHLRMTNVNTKLKKTTNHKTLRWANFVLSRNVGYSKRVCATLTIQFWYISTDIGLCIFPVKRRHEKEIKGTHKRICYKKHHQQLLNHSTSKKM